MDQYQKKYPDFMFLGAVPVDFDELPELGIKDLNFKELSAKGKKRIGIIFNLDEHYKNGSHWVAGFTDIDKGQVYFFDSYGIGPEPRIRKLLRRMARQSQDILRTGGQQEGVSGAGPERGKVSLDVRYNKHRHQFGNSECGVYSINFILRLLQGETFDVITENVTKDDTINKCRNTYFS